MVETRARTVHHGGFVSRRVPFLKAWQEDIVKPVSPTFDICDVDGEVTGQMELEENGETKKKIVGSYDGGRDVGRKEKEGDDRDLGRLVDPRKPTKEELEEHELCYVPYRSWCPVCGRAKGKELDHRKAVHGLGDHRSTPLTICSLEISSVSS